MSSRVIVTRPALDADVWVGKLHLRGFKALALPLIEIAAVSQPADTCALGQAWCGLSNYMACMFVSSNAVEHFFAPFLGLKTSSDQPIYAREAINKIALKIPPNVRFLAPGPGTGAALRAVGIPSSQIDMPPSDAEQFDSEALWQVIGSRDWRGAKVLIVRGKGDASQGSGGTGRDWLLQQWGASGSQVDLVSSYERRAPQLSNAQIELASIASQDGSIWLFSSSEAVHNLTAQPGLRDVNWQRARAIATHPRIQTAAEAAGWGVVHLLRPTLPDIVDALASIESKAI